MAHKIANHILIPEIAGLVAGGQDVLFTPSGVSMRPFIEGGRDSVVLTRAEEVRVGDVVLAQYGDIYVLHRVYRINSINPSSSSAATSSASGATSIILMGDGNLRGEEHIRQEDILAKVKEIRSPRGHRKPLTRACLWRHLLPIRWLLLKIYRKSLRVVVRGR